MTRPGTRPSYRPELRLSDADRDDAVARLSDHYAVGRLDKGEFDERSDAVWSARTQGDLHPVFADLGPVPGERPRYPGRPFGPWGRRGRFPLPFLPVVLVLIGLTAVTHVPFVLLALLGGAFVFSRRSRRRSGW